MKFLLFTTSQCPKCPEFKDYVADKITFEGEILNETHPQFMAKIQEFSVISAPTIIFFKDDKETYRTQEIYELEEFLASLKK